MFRDEPFDGPAEALRRPVEAALLQHPRNVVAGVVRPDPTYRRYTGSAWPGCVRRMQPFARPSLSQGLPAGAHGFRIAGQLTFGFLRLDPAIVRSEISARSSCATAPRTCSENMPWGVVVSIGSRSERK